MKLVPAKTIAIALCVLFPFVNAFGFEREGTGVAPERPLVFIENKGQVSDQNLLPRSDIQFKLSVEDMDIFVGNGQIHYQWSRKVTSTKGAEETGKESIEVYRMDVEFIGANQNAKLTFLDQQDYYENYYLPQCPNGVVAGSYGKVVYHDIYPGIDWVLYSEKGKLKYDLVVHQGADASKIRMRYHGATAVSIRDGGLVVETPFGKINEQKPYTYDKASGKEISSSFSVHNNDVTFNIASREGGFVIDPYLYWASYYGGTGDDYSETVFTGPGDVVYTGGGTSSGSNIATVGAHQTTIASSGDAFLAKLSSLGVRLWATYYGGNDHDGFDCGVAKGNDVYIAGLTYSNTGITTAGSHQSTFGGGLWDGMIIKFNTSGQRQWASYYGGNVIDNIHSIDVDGNGDLYICGETQSAGNIATAGSHQSVQGTFNWNAFLAKFNASGIRQWGTYYGVATSPMLTPRSTFYGLKCDALNNVYAVGMSEANFTNIATGSAFQTSYGGSVMDGMIVKFNSSGVRQWGTYFGDAGTDYLNTVGFDFNGDVYVGGSTTSSANISTAGSFQQVYAGGSSDALLAKFSPAGGRIWSTYYGGGGAEGIDALAINANDIICVAGQTGSTSGIATPGTYQTTSSSLDGWMATFNTSGVRQRGSYFGGSQPETFIDLAINNNYAFLTGKTQSTTGVTTTGSYQPTFGGGPADGFIAVFALDTAVNINTSFTDSVFCVGANTTFNLPYSTNFTFNAGNTFTAQLSDVTGSFTTPVALGSVTATGSGTIVCTVPGTVPLGTGYRIRIVSSNPVRTSMTNGKDIRIGAAPSVTASNNGPVCTDGTLNLTSSSATGASFSWTGPNSFSSGTQNPSITNVSSVHSGDYIVTATVQGCSAKDTTTVTITTGPGNITVTSNSPLCFGQNLNLSVSPSTAGVSYTWSGPAFSSTLQNPTINNVTSAAAGTYSVTAALNGCVSTGNTSVVVNPGPSVNIYASPNDTVCTGTMVSFVSIPVNAGPAPAYKWLKNGFLISGASASVYTTNALSSGDVISSILDASVSGVCTAPDTSNGITLTVVNNPVEPSVTISSTPALPLPGQLIQFTATAVNGGPSPVYQWQRNGQDIIGAAFANWSASNLHPYDKINVILKSSDLCATKAQVSSDTIVVNFPLSVNDLEASQALMLYPNPNFGTFNLQGFSETVTVLDVAVINAIGQIVYSDQIQVSGGSYTKQIALDAGLPAGRYMVKISNHKKVVRAHMVKL